jgi:hypothetical protein
VIRLTLWLEERKARAEISYRQKGAERAGETQGKAGVGSWVVLHTSTIS